MPEKIDNPELTALEAALGSLAPLPGQIDRDRLMFRAGQQIARRPGWLWPSATIVLACFSVTLAAILVLRPAPAPVERIVYLPAPEQPPGPPAPDVLASPAEAGLSSAEEMTSSGPAGNYYQLQKQMLRWGLDGLPDPQPAPLPAPPVSVDGLAFPPPGTVPPQHPNRPGMPGGAP
jgi:hypothetical protein